MTQMDLFCALRTNHIPIEMQIRTNSRWYEATDSTSLTQCHRKKDGGRASNSGRARQTVAPELLDPSGSQAATVRDKDAHVPVLDPQRRSAAAPARPHDRLGGDRQWPSPGTTTQCCFGMTSYLRQWLRTKPNNPPRRET